MRRRDVLILGGAAALAGGAGTFPAAQRSRFLVEIDRQPDAVISLWPSGPPGGTPNGLTEHIVHRENPEGLPDRAAHDITDPALSYFAAKDPTGAVMLLIPGGGYRYVVIEKEGWETARFLNTLGISAYVMTYRLPHQGWAAGPDTALQDAQRALRIVRARHRDAPIGAMGFSAGGHVAGMLGTRWDEAVYRPADETDRLSARPDRLFLIYAVVTMKDGIAHAGSRLNLLGADPSPAMIAEYSNEERVRPDMPPTFLLHAEDDAAVVPENTRLMARSLAAAGVPSDVRFTPSGGHGFGVRGLDGSPRSEWPGAAAMWLEARSLSGGAEKD